MMVQQRERLRLVLCNGELLHALIAGVTLMELECSVFEPEVPEG